MRFRKSGLLLFVLELLFIPFFIWLTRVPLTLRSAQSAMLVIFLFAVLSFTLLFIFVPKVEVLGYRKYKSVKVISTLLALMIITYVGYSLSSLPLFRSKDYYNLLGNLEERKFSADIEPFDANQIPFVDTDLASRLADKLMGNDTAMGSQFEVGMFTRQSINGKLTMVAPLNHKSFFSWLSNLDGTPGYITISATNPQDIKLVKEVNGKSVKIKHGLSSYLTQELVRHVRQSGYLTDLLTDYSFEVDDSGMPYWVITKYTNRIGWQGSDATGVITVNAVNGDVKSYDLNNAPKWIDRIQPKEFFVSQLANRGELVHGIFNFSDKDKLKPTGVLQVVYNKDRCYFYEGLTSIGRDNSTVGFVLTDTRTKKSYFYKMSGCLEEAAGRSAEGKVQNFGFRASSPIVVNIEGIPSFFMTLKDNEGLIKRYALVNIQNYQIVGMGESIQEARDDYIGANLKSSQSMSSDTPVAKKEIASKVLRIGSNTTGGNTIYYIVLSDNPSVIYKIVGSMSDMLPLTNINDNVRIVYNEQGNANINVLEFENLDLKK